MPIHDWSRVEAGIFHHFHHGWIEEIARALNHGLLPEDYYAMAEQHAAGFGPDVLTLQESGNGSDQERHLRRKQNSVMVHHVNGDHIVAMVEVVSPGQKSGRAALRSFVDKAAALLDKRIHLLILDLLPPWQRAPQGRGIDGDIWEELTGQEYLRPVDKPLTLAAYEADKTLRCFVEPVAVGDLLPDIPLFLTPGAHVAIPTEKTYQAAFAEVPGRWRRVLEK